MSSKIPEESTKGSLSFAEINKYIFGDSKVGKSLLASSMYIDKKRPYFITTEDNHSHLDVIAQKVTSWSGFIRLLVVLEENAVELRGKYSCLVVDIISDLADMLKADVCKKHGIKDLGDLGFGKGWGIEKTEWKDAIRRLMCIIPVIFIDHSKSSVMKEENEEYTKVVPVLPERLYKFISGKTPIIGAILQDKEGTYLDCTPSRELAAGTHFDALIGKKFRLKFKNITKVFKELRACIENKTNNKGDK